MSLRKLLQLDFLPRSADAGLLVLRLWLGLSLLLLHGWTKLTSFSEMAGIKSAAPRYSEFWGLGCDCFAF